MGRVVDSLGNPLDGGEDINADDFCDVDIRLLVLLHVNLFTSHCKPVLLAIDAMIPIGRGQRELIMRDDKPVKQLSLLIQSLTIINQVHSLEIQF